MPRRNSGPDGELVVTASGADALGRYRQGIESAEFLFCRHCGVLLAVVFASDEGMRGAVNVRCPRGGRRVRTGASRPVTTAVAAGSAARTLAAAVVDAGEGRGALKLSLPLRGERGFRAAKLQSREPVGMQADRAGTWWCAAPGEGISAPLLPPGGHPPTEGEEQKALR